MFNNGTTIAAVLLFLTVVVRQLLKPRIQLPRVGRSGLFGYVWTVIRSVLDSNGLVEEGCKQFGGKPFVFPSMSGEVVVIGQDNIDLLRRSNDSVFNAPEHNKKLFAVGVMFNEIVHDGYHVDTVLRSDLTKALTMLVPEVLEETKVTLPEVFKTQDTGSDTVPLFETMVHLVARISNRAVIGLPGCRNEAFLRHQVRVAEQAFPVSQLLNWFPAFIQPAVFKVFSLTLGSKDEAVRLVTPLVKERIEYAQQENPQTITDLLLRYAPEEDIAKPENLAVRIVHLNMASIHTTGIFLTHALFELARIPSQLLEELRAEIRAAVDAERGIFNKAAAGKLYKLDSLLKEIGRYHPLTATVSSRLVLQDAVLLDGTLVPKGNVVSIPPNVIHHDPELYSDPETFDPFRFSKLREHEDGKISDAKHSFTTLSNDYVVFGVGKHACPGRFFASLEIKIILSEILLNYDISFPPGTSEKPSYFSFNLFTMPNLTAKLTFTKKFSD